MSRVRTLSRTLSLAEPIATSVARRRRTGGRGACRQSSAAALLPQRQPIRRKVSTRDPLCLPSGVSGRHHMSERTWQQTHHEVSVRELTADDACAFYAIRLAALDGHPEAFGSSAEDWQGRSPEEVEERLHGHHSSADQFMLGAFDGDFLIGITGLMREDGRKRRHVAWIKAVYVRPEWRGKRVAARLLDDAIRLARNMPGLMQLHLGVGADNGSALRLYASRGFEVYGIERRGLLVNGRFVDEAQMQLFLGP